MSTSESTVRFLEDQLAGLAISTTRMFGEYCLYCDGKVVGFVCDDTLFIKPSPVDAALLDRTEPAPPYPGAKDYHSVPPGALEDRDWLQEVVQATADALPAPKPKKAPRAGRSAT
ncbi:TfoX/Sxy family protein [Lacisediminihabitans sp.]|uniref:TfoX/Sxy family protein n=1 Tax=Lacisediminihabitans sp. TaxID=2787631 RepID=UPI00374D0314